MEPQYEKAQSLSGFAAFFMRKMTLWICLKEDLEFWRNIIETEKMIKVEKTDNLFKWNKITKNS